MMLDELKDIIQMGEDSKHQFKSDFTKVQIYSMEMK
jgi:hypothetical protein